MSNRIIKRIVVDAILAGLAGTLAFLLVACGQTSTAKPPSTITERARTAAASSWEALPAAPIKVDAGLTSVWTGRELIVSGVRAGPDGTFLQPTEVAAAYDPEARSWRRLSAPPRLDGPCERFAAWTGSEMVVWGCFGKAAAFDPETNRWRSLPEPPTGSGITVWTGHKLIGWGGGCCGDAWSDGSAYDPAAGTWRKLARSPLAPSQGPIGAWTGREVILVVAGINGDEGKPYPASLARAAAYDPKADTWRRLAAPPELLTGSAVWDGHELIVAGGSRTVLAYDPAVDRWRRLAPLPALRFVQTMVWTGTRLLLWGASSAETSDPVPGFAYDPVSDRWSSLPTMPLADRETTAAWTGRTLLLLGGSGAGEAFRPAANG